MSCHPAVLVAMPGGAMEEIVSRLISKMGSCAIIKGFKDECFGYFVRFGDNPAYPYPIS